MRLSYRGINHEDARATLEMTEDQIRHMHRGQNQPLQYLRHIPDPRQTHDRKVCSIGYRSAQPSTTVPRPLPQPVSSASCRRWFTSNQREVLDELMNSHLRNIQRSLEHRLQVARAKGDLNLVRLLEAESKQMVLAMQ